MTRKRQVKLPCTEYGGIMISDDIKLLMGHCKCSLSANGDLLGAMMRIKKFVEESIQQPPKDKLKLPTMKKSLKNLHDSDWGWVDSQSYWYGARSMYRRICRHINGLNKKK